MPHVHIPASLRKLTGGVSGVTVEAATVRELISALDSRFPGIAARLIENDQLRQGLSIAIDSRISSARLSEPLQGDSEVVFLRSVAGG